MDDAVTYEWSDLSGAELRARLHNRGVSSSDATIFVQYREHPYWAERIEHIMTHGKSGRL